MNNYFYLLNSVSHAASWAVSGLISSRRPSCWVDKCVVIRTALRQGPVALGQHKHVDPTDWLIAGTSAILSTVMKHLLWWMRFLQWQEDVLGQSHSPRASYRTWESSTQVPQGGQWTPVLSKIKTLRGPWALLRDPVSVRSTYHGKLLQVKSFRW